MNVDNGGRTRLSTLFSGVSLLAMILLAGPCSSKFRWRLLWP